VSTDQIAGRRADLLLPTNGHQNLGTKLVSPSVEESKRAGEVRFAGGIENGRAKCSRATATGRVARTMALPQVSTDTGRAVGTVETHGKHVHPCDVGARGQSELVHTEAGRGEVGTEVAELVEYVAIVGVTLDRLLGL